MGLGHGRIARRGRPFPPAARRPPTGRIASGRSRRNPARRPHRTPPICAQGVEGWAGFAAGDDGGEDLTPGGRDGGRRLSRSGRGPTVIDENNLGTDRRRAWSRAPSLVAPWFAGGANADPGAGGDQRGLLRGNVAVANSALIGQLSPNNMADAPPSAQRLAEKVLLYWADRRAIAWVWPLIGRSAAAGVSPRYGVRLLDLGAVPLCSSRPA